MTRGTPFRRSANPLLITVLLSATATSAAAGVIRPVTATSDDPLLFGDLANLIDGVIDFDSNAGIGNAASAPFTGPYTIRFGLDAGYTLTGLQLWNNAGNIENDGEGIDAFTLRFLDAGEGLLGEFSSNATDTLAMQEFAFNAAGVHAVDLVILSNHAPALRDYAAVYEVAFVPGPGATAVLGLAGLAIVRRRQR